MNIRIGAADYDVQYTDDAIILNGRECIADVDYNLCKIRLSSNRMGDGRQAVTLMHEIAHAIMNEQRMDDPIVCNEALIDAIAYGMVDFIRDNPEIVDKIKNGERLSI